mgnify:CR=1 FL=1
MKGSIFIYTPMAADDYGAFSCDQDEVEKEASWCFLCGIGEDHKDIKLCKECFEYLMNEL